MTTDALALFALTDRPAWMDRRAETAVCAQTDPDLWFPDKGNWTSSRAARALCQTCPLLAACRSWALTHPDEAREGIWGGLTERERCAERRRREQTVPDMEREAA